MIDKSLLPAEADVQYFQDNGYWRGGKVVDDSALAQLCAAMEEVYAGRYETGKAPWNPWSDGGDPGRIRKIDNAHWANDTIRQLALDETVGAMAARLMQTDEVRLWHDQLLYKPGQDQPDATRSGNVGWHQDHGYWRCAPPTLITAWVAFVDVDLSNGCMQVLPGSHQWGLLPHSDFFDGDLESMQARIEAHTGRPFVTAPLDLKAGEVSFHHCLTVHGSGPNTTNAPRRSLVMHLMPGDARYVSGTPDDKHMNAFLMQRGGGMHGDLFNGEAWPVLYAASSAG
ncbi:MAG: phytanoyl-CoA dioxygenase family protein [bacterium]|nr:phytanoyl-CoA dioxygenase family protein [bacterium]